MIEIYVVSKNCAVEETNNFLDLWESELIDYFWRKSTSFGIKAILISSFFINYVTLNKLFIFSEFCFLLFSINYER